MTELAESAFGGQAALEEDRARGERLLAELREGRRSWAELNDEEQRLASGVALIELVQERSLALRFDNPAEMIDLARTGCLLADSLAIDPYGDRVVSDIRARAWAELGNAYRVADDLQEAGGALARARELAMRGTGSLTLLSRLMELIAHLLSDLRQFQEAAELLETVEAVHRQREEVNDLARVLVHLGNVRNEAHEPEHAVLVFLRALQLLEVDSPLRFAAVHGLAYGLVESGFHDAAHHLIKKNRRLYRRSGKFNQIRLFWLEGKIARGLGQFGRAEAKFHVARLWFLRENQTYDSALVALDLALLYVRQGRRQEVLWLVEKMLATFRSLGIGREAIASLVLLQKSCEQQRSVDVLCGQIEALARLLPELEARKGDGRTPRA
ncbi:MAG TPA: hypothetical protein VGG03_19855 [Thermoanaerobaculia bacterium]